MARTKISHLLQASSSTRPRDPWEVEHDIYLHDHPNAIAHSDTIYTGVVHKGFDADIVAEELIRRYPPFEENEQHHEFLKRNLFERRLLAGERDDYFTPQQLWEEDDRIQGRKRFSSDGEQSWLDEDVVDDDPAARVAKQEYDYKPAIAKWMPKDGIGEDHLESDEQLAELLSDPAETSSKHDSPLASPQKPGEPAMTEADMTELFSDDPDPPVITVTTPEKKTGTPQLDDAAKEADEGFPIVLQSNGHSTTITLDYSDSQDVLASLDLTPEADLTAVASTFVDGSLVLAILGRAKIDDLPSDDIAGSAGPTAGTAESNSNPPAEVSSSSESGIQAIDQQPTDGTSATSKEWSLLTQRPHHSKLAFLSGPRTYSALTAEVCWDEDSVISTILEFDDGRLLAILVGKQQDPASLDAGIPKSPIDPADHFYSFFTTLRKHESGPEEHDELASLLQIAQQDMISAGTLSADDDDDDDDDDDSDSEYDFETEIPEQGARSTDEHIELLESCIAEMERKIYLATEAQKLPPMHSFSCDEERMRFILTPPKADYTYFSYLEHCQPEGYDDQQQQVSGFPANFGQDQDLGKDFLDMTDSDLEKELEKEIEEEIEEERDMLSNSATHTTLGKRRRDVSDDGDGELTDANGDDNTGSTFLTPEKPQRPRKIPKLRDAPKRAVKKRARKAATAAERKQKILVLKVRLAGKQGLGQIS